jgi:hypothetical protein
VKQLEYIINYVGTPTKEDLEATSGNERASKYAASLGMYPPPHMTHDMHVSSSATSAPANMLHLLVCILLLI